MLDIKNLNVKTRAGQLLVQDVSLELQSGQVIGLTGASGAGKTTLLKIITGTYDKDYKVTSGLILFKGSEINGLSAKKRRQLCGTSIGYIPQNPMTAFNPRQKLGAQVEETLKIRLSLSRTEARNRFREILEKLNLSDGERLLNSYPSELSGGMLQRAAITLVMCLEPEIILADEPTSALDKENRDALIDVLKLVKKDVGILFASHDIDVLLELCDSVCVMEAGSVVERDQMHKIMKSPNSRFSAALNKAHKEIGERQLIWKAYD